MKNLLKSFLQQFFNPFWGQHLEHSCALRDFSMYPGLTSGRNGVVDINLF